MINSDHQKNRKNNKYNDKDCSAIHSDINLGSLDYSEAGLSVIKGILISIVCFVLIFLSGGILSLSFTRIEINLNEPEYISIGITYFLITIIILVSCIYKGFLCAFIVSIIINCWVVALLIAASIISNFAPNIFFYILLEEVVVFSSVIVSLATTSVCVAVIEFISNCNLLSISISLIASLLLPIILKNYYGGVTITQATLVSILGVSILSNYVSYKSLDIRGKNNHFSWIRKTALTIISSFGTSFRGVDLTDADFTGAILRNTDFTNANLARACFYRAQGLDYAKVDGTILVNPVVIDLLTSKKGQKKSFQKLNLRGANLAGADLRGSDFSGADLQDATLEKAILERAILVGANLKGANLAGVDLSYANLKEADISSANLKSANLEWVNLTNALAVGTDLTQAKLNGVCLGEVWNIDSTTVLDDIECDFFYRLEEPLPGTDDRDRQPASGKFQPGDFIKLHKKITDTVQILLHNGVNNWQAVANALKKIIDENIGIDASSIQSIERRENDLLVNVQVPPGTEKAEIHEYLMEAYQVRLEAAKNAALLEAEIRHTHDIKEIAIAAIMKHEASQAIVSINNNSNSESNTINETTVDTKAISEATSESKAMNDSTDASRKVELNNVQGNLVGGFGGEFNATGAVLNIGEISGTVTSAINQLPDEPKSDKPGIKDLLTDLQKAIEADTNLNPDDKAEALEKVKVLAAAAQKPQAAETQKEAKGALRFLKGLTTELPSVTDFVKACSQLLPAIATLLGLVA